MKSWMGVANMGLEEVTLISSILVKERFLITDGIDEDK